LSGDHFADCSPSFPVAHSLASLSEQCFVGLVLEVGLSLRGHEHDLLAYIDGLTHANVRGIDGVVMPMRHVTQSEPRISSLSVTMHNSKAVSACGEQGLTLKGEWAAGESINAGL
jgi:hypothetical protein